MHRKPVLAADFDNVRWVEAVANIQLLLDSPLAAAAAPSELAAAHEAMALLALQGLDWPAWLQSPAFPAGGAIRPFPRPVPREARST